MREKFVYGLRVESKKKAPLGFRASDKAIMVAGKAKSSDGSDHCRYDM